MSSSFQSFLEARDLLLAHRTDYETARREFRWPKLDRFNWALDYFDVMARENDGIALWVVDDAGEVRLSFDKCVRRIEITDLPKTISGKIRRGELSRREGQMRQRSGRGDLEFFEDDFQELRA
jgi:acyl-coenzyme A synthetase/AMP-(fatty) acid ligase